MVSHLAEQPLVLSVQCWVVFGFTLVMCAVIGIYFTCTGGKQRSVEEFFMADRNMNWILVAASLFSSFMSALTVIGTPLEVYSYGTTHMWMILGYPIATWVSGTVFIPVFHRLKVTTVNQYLKMRFNPTIAHLNLCAYIVMMVTYMSMVLYAPCLIFKEVFKGQRLDDTSICIMVAGLVCTFYTTLGGMKAVLWTDFFQVAVMFSGVFVILIIGLQQEGGLAKVWEVAEQDGRLDFKDPAKILNPIPKFRESVWPMTFGSAATWISLYSVNQTEVQRALTIKSLKNIRRAYMTNAVFLPLLGVICSLIGLVIYSHYRYCDPLGHDGVGLEHSLQLMPKYVMRAMREYKGLTGLVLAAIFGASLSTISSGINSIASCVYYDIFLEHKPELSESHGVILSKILALCTGILVIITALFLSTEEKFSNSLLMAGLCNHGLFGGPMLGLFILGMFTKSVNSTGAGVSYVLGYAVNIIIGLWFMVDAKDYSIPPLPHPHNNCTSDDIPRTTMITQIEEMPPSEPHINDLCYQIIVFAGLFVVLLLGYPISKIATIICPEKQLIDKKEADNGNSKQTSLRASLRYCLCCCVPKSAWHSSNWKPWSDHTLFQDLESSQPAEPTLTVFKYIRDNNGKVVYAIRSVNTNLEDGEHDRLS